MRENVMDRSDTLDGEGSVLMILLEVRESLELKRFSI